MNSNPRKAAIIVPVGLHSRSLIERLRLVAAAYDDPFDSEEIARSNERGGLEAKTHRGSSMVAG
jgi:hypothetical protein